MRTANVEIFEHVPPIMGADDIPMKQPPKLLGRFTVQDERIDGLRRKAKAKAQSYLRGRKFSIQMGEYDERRKSHAMYVTCRPESR